MAHSLVMAGEMLRAAHELAGTRAVMRIPLKSERR
jgi:hypothetical protein